MKNIKLFEDFNNDLAIDDIKTPEELEDFLVIMNMPVKQWGTGYAKTVKHLFDELYEDECKLEIKKGVLTRHLEFVSVKVYYSDGINNFYLKEEKQVFKDGRERKRNMTGSVSEKMIMGEDPMKAAIRGVSEELDIKINSDQIVKIKDVQFGEESKTYPGLKSEYKQHIFRCNLTQDQYNPDGYIEHQGDKSTYFVWELIK